MVDRRGGLKTEEKYLKNISVKLIEHSVVNVKLRKN